MKTNNRKPVLAANQKTGMKIETTAGISSTAARPKNITAKTGSVKRSRRRAGFRPWYRQTAPASGQIERDAIGFRERRDQENEEAENLRHRALEDVPFRQEPEVEALLRLHDLAQAERIREQKRRGDGKR